MSGWQGDMNQWWQQDMWQTTLNDDERQWQWQETNKKDDGQWQAHDWQQPDVEAGRVEVKKEEERQDAEPPKKKRGGENRFSQQRWRAMQFGVVLQFASGGHLLILL